MTAHVRQRDREIAVRLALGASVANVRRLVLVEAGRLVGPGALLGAAGAVAGTRFLRGLLYEVQPMDSTMSTAWSESGEFESRCCAPRSGGCRLRLREGRGAGISAAQRLGFLDHARDARAVAESTRR